MISCDDVFMVLTRGPFPTGRASDAAVESHLERCGTCRRLAEALRPSEDMVPEMVPPEESRSLPSYWGPSPAIEPRVLSAVLSEFDYGETEQQRGPPLRMARCRRRALISWSGLFAFLGAVSVGASVAVLYYGVTARVPLPSQVPAVVIPSQGR